MISSENKNKSQEILLAAWNLLLSQRPHFLINHLERDPITPNQEGTMEMKHEVLSSVVAQVKDPSGYQVSDLDDFEFYWEIDRVREIAFFKSVKKTIGTP